MSEGVGQVGAVGVVVARVNQRVKKPAQGVEMRTVILLYRVEKILMCCVVFHTSSLLYPISLSSGFRDDHHRHPNINTVII